MEIVQLSPTDSFSKSTIYSILNHGHDKKIRRNTLDFYRNGSQHFLGRNGIIIWVVAIDDNGNRVGVSGCAFGCKSKQVMHSITVVHPEFRKQGYGKKLLSAKIEILKSDYPKAKYRSFVNIKNKASIKTCLGVGLTITKEGTRKRKGKDPTHFFVFKDIR